MTSSMINNITKFSQNRPEWQLLIVTCLRLSESREDRAFLSGEALNLAQCQDRRPLTPLCALQILETVKPSTKNYRNAWYRVRDPKALRQALVEMGIDPDANLPGDFFNRYNRKAS
jgi:hypothetical protein